MTARINTRNQVIAAARLLAKLPVSHKVVYLTKKIDGMVSTDTGTANWKAYQSGIMKAFVRPSALGMREASKGDPGRIVVEINLEMLPHISFGNSARWHMVNERLQAAAGEVQQDNHVEKVTTALKALKEMGLLTEAVRKELSHPLAKFLKKADVNPLDLMLK